MLFFLLASIFPLFSLVSALPVVSPVKRDVWAPPVVYPNSSTVWVAGDNYTVTWNISSEPSEITNLVAELYLRHANEDQITLIAQDFLLTAGEVNVTVPVDTQPSTSWIVMRKSIIQQDPTRGNK